MGKLSYLFLKMKQVVRRNAYDGYGFKLKKKRVNLVYWRGLNLGDTIAPVIFNWMLERKGISPDQKTKKTYSVTTLGSIIHTGMNDVVVWGSGTLHTGTAISVFKRRFKKYDIRSVRGPLTAEMLLHARHGLPVPEIYGDPAVLMPLIFKPEIDKSKIVDCSLVLHFMMKNLQSPLRNSLNEIDVKTDDYKTFITKLVHSRKVISSSLHGLILAESYGIPAVYLYQDKYVTKYYDYYYSTGRYSVKIAKTLEEAVEMTPMPLPTNIEQLQQNVLNSFPYDLWEK